MNSNSLPMSRAVVTPSARYTGAHSICVTCVCMSHRPGTIVLPVISTVWMPAGIQTVDMTGKTIVPGLWDMHTHVTQIEWAPVYLAEGVTTARDMGNEFEFITVLRDAIAAKRAIGPRLLLAGLVDGGGPDAFGVTYAATPDEAKKAVAKYHDAGFQ